MKQRLNTFKSDFMFPQACVSPKRGWLRVWPAFVMMTSSNGNNFRDTGSLCWEFAGHRWIFRTKASDAGLRFFCDLRLNKRFSKQSQGWWFETVSCPLWRHCNDVMVIKGPQYRQPWYWQAVLQYSDFNILRVTFVDMVFCMMTLWIGNAFRVTGPLWGESAESPHKEI